jgi:hypothetical protein
MLTRAERADLRLASLQHAFYILCAAVTLPLSRGDKD